MVQAAFAAVQPCTGLSQRLGGVSMPMVGQCTRARGPLPLSSRTRMMCMPSEADASNIASASAAEGGRSLALVAKAASVTKSLAKATWSRLALLVTLSILCFTSMLPRPASARTLVDAARKPALLEAAASAPAVRMPVTKDGAVVVAKSADPKAEAARAEAAKKAAKQAKDRAEAAKRAAKVKADEIKSKALKKAKAEQEAKQKAEAKAKADAAAARAKKDEAGKKAPSVMLSMKTPQEKKRLIAGVTVAYAAVWAFFYFTHDSGEVSE